MLTVYDEGYKKKVSLLNLGEFTSDEPSGLKVNIPIKREDSSAIENIVNEHCKFLYNQVPLINGKPAKLAPKIVEGNGWYITYDFNDCIVGLIGGMPNKIGNISEYIKSNSYNKFDDNRLGLVIEIPIGSVTQTASKDIQKSKITENTLTHLFNNFKKEVVKAYQTKLDNIDNLVEAVHLLAPLSLPQRSNYNWREITFDYSNNIAINDCIIKQVNYNKKSFKYSFFKCNNSIYIYTGLKVFINDLENRDQSLLAQKIGERCPSAYIICKPEKENFNDLYNFPLLSSIISEDELLNLSKVKKQSSVPKKKVDSSCVTAYELRFNSCLQPYCSTNKVRVPKNPNNTLYYLELNDSNKSLVNFNNYYNSQTKYTPIYLFKEINKLNLDVWIDFNAYLKEKIDSLLKKTPKLLEVVDLLENHIELWEVLIFFKEIESCDLKDLYNEVYNIYNLYTFNLTDEEINLLKLETYNQTKLNEINEIKLNNSLLKEYKRMETKYPIIFKYFSRQNTLGLYKCKNLKDTELTIEEVNEYIKLINR